MAEKITHEAAPGDPGLGEIVERCVQGLYADHKFGDYPEAGGTLHETWPVEMKVVHPYRLAVNQMPGQVAHLGDVPFGPPLRDIVSWEDPPQVVQEDVSAKSTSIRKTLEACFPRDLFGEYIKKFAADLDSLLARKELGAAREVLKIQFAREQTVGTYYHSDFEAALLSRNGDKARNAAIGAYEKREALDCPALVLSFSVYLAAHRAYLSQLYDAIGSHAGMKKDAHVYGNTLAALNNSLQFIPEATVYEAIMTTMLHERARLTEASPSMQPQSDLSAEELLTLEAIGKGWERIFLAGMLTSRNMFYVSGDEKIPVTVVCPAKPHFRWAQADRILQHIYCEVLSLRTKNTALYRELLAATKSATYDALNGAKPYLELTGTTVTRFLSPAQIAQSFGITLSSTSQHPQPSLAPKPDPSGRYPFPVYDRSALEALHNDAVTKRCPFASQIGSVALPKA